jgi:hypothetical protein
MQKLGLLAVEVLLPHPVAALEFEPPGTTVPGSGPFFTDNLTGRHNRCEIKDILQKNISILA